MIALAAAALAGPVICDPQGAAALVADARIAPRRAPVTHPELVPGLALASPSTDPALREALSDLCAAPEVLSIAPGDRWEDSGFTAITWLLVASAPRGCALVQRGVAVSVGIGEDGDPHYALRGPLPEATTPIGDCPTPVAWRDEQVLAGEGSPVRVVLVADRVDGAVVRSEVLARRATAAGWSEQTLLAPAPPRALGGFDGPLLSLVDGADGPWIAAHADRVGGPDACAPVPDQTVWTHDGAAWVAHTGRDALALLASRGRWRLAGTDGWLHLVAQDDDVDAEVLAYRHRRLQRRYPEPLHVWPSAELPGLNPGFLVVAPAPFPAEAEARAARDAWRSLHRHYVKRAWTAPDPCSGADPR